MVLRRKDGRIRVCIDYSKLNKMVERNHSPMPLIEDVVDAFADLKGHSVLDLKDGFFHIDIAKQFYNNIHQCYYTFGCIA